METNDMKQKKRITATLLDNLSRDEFRSGHLTNKNDLDTWEIDLRNLLHRVADYPEEEFAWGHYTLSNGGYFVAILDDEEGIETLDVRSPVSQHSLDETTMSAEAASLLANLLYLNDLVDCLATRGEDSLAAWNDLAHLNEFVMEHPEREGILTCFQNFNRDYEAEDLEDLADSAVEAYMESYGLGEVDLSEANQEVCEEVETVIRVRIEAIAQVGVLTDAQAIADEAWKLGLGVEIEEIANQEYSDQNDKEVRYA